MNDSQSNRYRYIRFMNDEPYRRFVRANGDLKHQQANTPTSFIMRHGPYVGGLLFRREWITRRKEILLRDQHRCRVCGSSQNLQVHHRQYHFVVRKNQFKLPWEYEDKLLITLCEQCNRKGHRKYKVPTINI
ncbi:MAG: hypothetical protein E6Q24_18955 [Chitinophagaceae bacterium]|jgi:5-methylcytosine-specific restriction endonuclease McrA|nr:MAG: hypothetical protein E6Q24_18955 [Chitinophagaceae bacterium]HEX2846663.1 hypothetical protein [Chitinophagaceae bacterium]